MDERHEDLKDVDVCTEQPGYSFSLPEQIFIGYYAHIKKRDLLKYVGGYVESHCNSPKTARYQVRKYLHGYMYEIHDGGNAGGVLGSVINLLNNGEHAIVRTASRKILITSADSGPASYLMREGDPRQPSASVDYKNTLKPAHSSGNVAIAYGITVFVSGLCIAVAGLAANSMSETEARQPVFEVANKVTPFDGLLEIREQMPSRSQHVDRLSYRNGNWEVRLRSNEAFYSKAITSEEPDVSDTVNKVPDNNDAQVGDQVSDAGHGYQFFGQRAQGLKESFEEQLEQGTGDQNEHAQ